MRPQKLAYLPDRSRLRALLHWQKPLPDRPRPKACLCRAILTQAGLAHQRTIHLSTLEQPLDWNQPDLLASQPFPGIPVAGLRALGPQGVSRSLRKASQLALRHHWLR